MVLPVILNRAAASFLRCLYFLMRSAVVSFSTFLSAYLSLRFLLVKIEMFKYINQSHN